MAGEHVAADKFDWAKFDIFVRFMIVAAENKRFVEYNELTKVFGFSLQNIRDYAAALGRYCKKEHMPPLSALVVNTKDGRPGDGYFDDPEHPEEAKGQAKWGKDVVDCFVKFKLSIPKRFVNTSGISDKIREFIKQDKAEH